MIETKIVTISVDLDVRVPHELTDDEINDITFGIPIENVTVFVDSAPTHVASVVGYCTQEYYPDPE